MTTKFSGIKGKQMAILVIALFFMVPLFFAAKGVFSVLGQTTKTNDRVVKKESFKNEPIEFISITSDGHRIKTGEKFTRNGEWLMDLTFEIKNTSGKPIVYLAIVLLFPETAGNEPPKVYFLKYGINPLVSKLGLNTRQTDDPRLLNPEATAQVKLSSDNFRGLKELVAQNKNIEDLTEVNYRIGAVFFEDGSQWSGGSYLRPDPERPGKFIPIEQAIREEK